MSDQTQAGCISQKRKMEKCERCRRQKIKCDWLADTPRDFSKGEKCGRCTKLNLECGPDVKAPKTKKRKQLVAAESSSQTEMQSVSIASRSQDQSQSQPQPREIYASEWKTTENDHAGLRIPGSEDMQHRGQAPISGPPIVNQSALRLQLKEMVSKLSAHCRVNEYLLFQTTGIPQALEEKRDLMAQHDLDKLVSDNEYQTRDLLPKIEDLASLVSTFNVDCAELTYTTCVNILSKFKIKQHNSNFFDTWTVSFKQRLHQIHEDNGDWYQVNPSDIYVPSSQSLVNKVLQDTQILEATLRGLNDHATSCIKVGSAHISPVEVALQENMPNVAADLLATSPDTFTITNLLDRTGLHILADHGQVHLLEQTLPHQVKSLMNSRDIFSRTAILLAASHTDVPSLELLSKFDANPNVRGYDGSDGLLIAATQGCENTLDFFLRNSADPNDYSTKSTTPLHEAARAGHLKICQKLLTPGSLLAADAFSQCKGKTASELASENGHHDIAQYILDASVQQQSSSSANPESILYQYQAALQGEEGDLWWSNHTYFQPESSHQS